MRTIASVKFCRRRSTLCIDLIFFFLPPQSRSWPWFIFISMEVSSLETEILHSKKFCRAVCVRGHTTKLQTLTISNIIGLLWIGLKGLERRIKKNEIKILRRWRRTLSFENVENKSWRCLWDVGHVGGPVFFTVFVPWSIMRLNSNHV